MAAAGIAMIFVLAEGNKKVVWLDVCMCLYTYSIWFSIKLIHLKIIVCYFSRWMLSSSPLSPVHFSSYLRSTSSAQIPCNILVISTLSRRRETVHSARSNASLPSPLLRGWRTGINDRKKEKNGKTRSRDWSGDSWVGMGPTYYGELRVGELRVGGWEWGWLELRNRAKGQDKWWKSIIIKYVGWCKQPVFWQHFYYDFMLTWKYNSFMANLFTIASIELIHWLDCKISSSFKATHSNTTCILKCNVV